MDFDPLAFLSAIITSDAFASLLLTAVASAVTAVSGAVIYYVRKRVLKDLDAAELAQLREIAAQAVRYAEQRFKDAAGDVKLAQAMAAADAMLASYGIKVTTSMLRTVIEAAVYSALADDEPSAPSAAILNAENVTIEATASPEPADTGDVDAAPAVEPVAEVEPAEELDPRVPQPGRALRLHGK